MATLLVSFRAVRPAVFAGALAVAWLTFSAPSGAADTDSGSLLGTTSTAASAVSSIIADAAESVDSGPATSVEAVTGSTVPAAPAALPPAPAPVADTAPVPGVLQPLLEAPAAPAGDPVSHLPVVTGLDPADTVAMATDQVSPVTDVLTPVVAGLDPADTVAVALDQVSPVTDLLARVVDEVAVPGTALQPVSDLVTDGALLDVPDLIPGQVGDLVVGDPAVPVPPGNSAVDTGAAAGSPGLGSAGRFGTLAPGGFLTDLLSGVVVAASASLACPGFQAGDGAAERGSSTEGSSGDTMPAPMRTPGSASGSGQSFGGSHGFTGWLSSSFEDLSLPGAFPVSGPPQHVPAPVSFDPGSSPD